MVSSFNGVLSLMVTAIKGTYASNDEDDGDNDGNVTPILTPLAYGVFRSSIVVVLFHSLIMVRPRGIAHGLHPP